MINSCSVYRSGGARSDSAARVVSVREVDLSPPAGQGALRQEEVREGGLHEAAGGRDLLAGELSGVSGAQQCGWISGRGQFQGSRREGRRRVVALSDAGGNALTFLISPLYLRFLQIFNLYTQHGNYSQIK